MIDEPTGGPAFPNPLRLYRVLKDEKRSILPNTGMTLRDWFAGQALAGLISAKQFGTYSVSTAAYEYADGMLKARDGTQEPPVQPPRPTPSTPLKKY